MKRFSGALLALLATNVHADTLSDLKTSLARLSAKEPVRATMTIEQAVKSSGKFSNTATTRTATAELRHDESGISITIPQDLLDKASKQAWSSNVGENSAQDAIGAIRSLSVIEALNFRDTLAAMLHGATVLEDKSVPYRGAPARMLVLKLAPKPQKSGGNRIQLGKVTTDDRLKLWIGADNLPLGGERTEKTTAGFMFLNGTFSSRTLYTFTHTRDRLVLTRLETADGGSGLGQNIEKKSAQTVTIR